LSSPPSALASGVTGTTAVRSGRGALGPRDPPLPPAPTPHGGWSVTDRFSLPVGSRFGRYTVVGEKRIRKGKNSYQECRCDCGMQRAVAISHLKSGKSRSCGCSVADRLTKHGFAGTDEYNIYLGMVARCRGKRGRDHLYRDRGVVVCARWLGSFEAFLADVGPRPSSKHSIDRYPDPNGNYEPGNVRWATPLQQGANKRNNFVVEINGERLILAEAARRLGLSTVTLRRRVLSGRADGVTLISRVPT
jgi:hypothetical protein